MTLCSSSRLLQVGLGALALGAAGPAGAADTPIGSTTFGGTIFLNATRLDQFRNGQRSAISRDGVDLTRLYLDVDHRFSKRWSARLTTDINWIRDESPTDLWVKRAYLQGAFSKAFILRLGSADMPWGGFVNSWSGFRYVDKELVTRLKYGASADWGIHTLGTLGGNGSFQYAISAVSGSSFKRPRTGNSADVESRIAWQPTRHTVLAVGGYHGKLALDGGEHVTYHTARRWDAMAAYADDTWRFGAQYFRATNWNQVRSPRGDRASGWSVWASLKLAPQWSAFVRHDQTDTNEMLDPTRHERYRNLGVEWAVSRDVKIAAVYKRQYLANLSRRLSAFNEVGLWAQIGF